jgi:hypothetical protein
MHQRIVALGNRNIQSSLNQANYSANPNSETDAAVSSFGVGLIYSWNWQKTSLSKHSGDIRE